MIFFKENKKIMLDDEDLQKTNGFTFSFLKTRDKNKNYLRLRKGKTDILLHRYILGLTDIKGVVIDHINGNGLDNRKENLRVCLNNENLRNRKHNKNNKINIKNIYFCNNRKKWCVCIKIKGKSLFRKRFDSLEDAITARNEQLKKHHGKFAYLETT